MRTKTDLLLDSLLKDRFHTSEYPVHSKQDGDSLRKSLMERAAVSRSLINMLFSDQNEETLKILDDGEIHLMNLAMVQALENACYFNDEDTGHHVKRVSRYSAALAEGLGCPLEFVKRIQLYAPLHDVGKVGIPDHILKKKGRFTEDETHIMRQHVVIGARFLDGSRIDPMAKNIALYHHEKWDGTGYFHRLKGEEIPLEARILSAADVYDALSFDRVYRKALPEERIDTAFRKRSGTHFDPRITDTYFNIKDRLIEIKNKELE